MQTCFSRHTCRAKHRMLNVMLILDMYGLASVNRPEKGETWIPFECISRLTLLEHVLDAACCGAWALVAAPRVSNAAHQRLLRPDTSVRIKLQLLGIALSMILYQSLVRRKAKKKQAACTEGQ